MILDLKQSAIYSAHIQACMEDNTLSLVESNKNQHTNISRHQIQTCLSIRFLFHQLQYLLSQKTLLHLYSLFPKATLLPFQDIQDSYLPL